MGHRNQLGDSFAGMAYAFFGTLAILIGMKFVVYLATRRSSSRKKWWELKGAGFGPGAALEDGLEATELHEVRADRTKREADQEQMRQQHRQMREDIRMLLKREEERREVAGNTPVNGERLGPPTANIHSHHSHTHLDASSWHGHVASSSKGSSGAGSYKEGQRFA